MKIIITESQHNKLKMKQWLLRRQELFMNEYNQSLKEINPCNYDDSERYINMVIHYTTDGLHPEYYLNNNFYVDLLYNVIFDMVHVDLTEKYDDRNCE